jgi:hypothetical protein
MRNCFPELRFDEARRLTYTVIHEIQPQLASINGTLTMRKATETSQPGRCRCRRIPPRKVMRGSMTSGLTRIVPTDFKSGFPLGSQDETAIDGNPTIGGLLIKNRLALPKHLRFAFENQGRRP